MAVKSKEEILNQIKTILGENDSDEAIQLIEDVTDTMGNTDEENWKDKYEENDKAWRKKYRDRFFPDADNKKEEKEEKEEEEEEEEEITTFEELFKEEN